MEGVESRTTTPLDGPQTLEQPAPGKPDNVSPAGCKS
jgi:hypothetical protein